jgi:tetratricopeptide (TPR) repeat protein
MRLAVLLAATALAGGPAFAADQLKFGPPPEWVIPQAIPQQPSKANDAPIAVLLSDSQVYFDRGKVTAFSEVAAKIQTPQGLSGGNIAFAWQPATDAVTVNKLHLIRDGKVIDLLKDGQTFTVLRRETNLEAATLDGALTAAIQSEGVQVGDIVDFATTSEHSDSVLGDHVEDTFATWNNVPIQYGHVRLSWPDSMELITRQTESVPKAQVSVTNGRHVLEISAQGIEPLISPSGAPPRFLIGRLGEATNFASWSQLADLMRPLYDKAGVVPASGPLRDELETIRKTAKTPKQKVELALQLTEQRVRYVALEMGTGGYVPAAADVTWSRRFADCKGKTALLLALLRELGIEAEPVLVHHSLGDILPERLPMIGYFDHVLVRAHLDGKEYWLDGTRTGDGDLDRIPVPNFEWGLPVAASSKLVPITPKALTEPESETAIDIDVTAGAYAPALFKASQTYRGDDANGLNSTYAAIPAAQRDAAMKEYWRSKYDYVDVQSVGWSFDPATDVAHMTMTGSATLDWDRGFYVPESSIAYKPDFERAVGPSRDAPFALNFPVWNTAHITVRLPRAFAGKQRKLPQPVNEVQGGTQYQRTINIDGSTVSIETSERTLQAELAYKDAIAQAPRLKALYDDDVYLRVPTDYVANPADLAGLAARKPASASDFVDRGNIYLDAGKIDLAIADFGEAHRLDPANAWALADRGLSYVWKRDFAAAEKDLAATEAIDPNNYVLLRARGLLAEAKGEFQAAADDFTKSLQGNPGDDFARLHRASALASLWKFDDALRDLNPMIAQDPKNAAALTQRAWIYTHQNKLDAARVDLSAALAIDPKNSAVLVTQAAFAEQQGDEKGAIAALTLALESSPGDADTLVKRAQAYYSAGEYEKALADTEAAAKDGAMPPEARLARANIFRSQGKHNLVVQEAELLVKENPDSDFSQVAAGKIFSAEGQRDKAVDAITRALAIKPRAYIYINRSQVRAPTDLAGQMADLDEALKLEPNSSDALSLKAQLLLRQGRYADSIRTFDAAIANESGDKLALRQLRAVALYKAGQTTEAEKEFAAVRSQATQAVQFNNLCWNKATANILLESALDECRQALKLRPDSAGYADSLGMVLLRLGKLDESIAAYTQAIGKSRSAASLLGRAFAYAGKGDMARANADRAEALRLNGDVEAQFDEYGLKFPGAQAQAGK